MSLVTELSNRNDVAMSIAAAIEHALGGELILAVGLPRTEAPNHDLLPTGAARVVSIPFASGVGGGISLAVGEAMARTLEASATDESLLTATGPALTEGAKQVASIAEEDVRLGKLVEGSIGELVDENTGDEFVVWPLLDGSERVATIVVRVAPAVDVTPASVTVHEFPALQTNEINLGGDTRPLSLLHDVEMGVTAELGRRRMTVRDLLSLTPGAVIELDRAAGSPVDVLVNGTLIARGEVVVIDEEFGIRISEIVAPDVAAAS